MIDLHLWSWKIWRFKLQLHNDQQPRCYVYHSTWTNETEQNVQKSGSVAKHTRSAICTLENAKATKSTERRRLQRNCWSLKQARWIFRCINIHKIIWMLCNALSSNNYSNIQAPIGLRLVCRDLKRYETFQISQLKISCPFEMNFSPNVNRFNIDRLI